MEALAKKRRESADLRELAGLVPEPFASKALARADKMDAEVARELERMRLFVAIESYRNNNRWSPGMTRSEQDACRPHAKDVGLSSIDAAGNALGVVSPRSTRPGA
tara:strand:- start:2379 stop:2696 length:318 start_codon:yes stop_codon:yes gene_type:complete